MLRRLMIRLIGVGAIVALAALAMPALSRPPADEHAKDMAGVAADLKLVPADATHFLSVRLADVEASAAGKLLMLTPPGESLARAIRGVPVGKIERVTIFERRPSQGTLAVIHTAKAHDIDAVRKALGTGTEAKAGGKTFHHTGDPGGRAVWAADKQTLVVGPVRALVPYLAALEKAAKTHPLADELKVASGKHAATFGGLPSQSIRVSAAEGPRWDRDRYSKKYYDEKKYEYKEFPPKDRFEKEPPRPALDVETLRERPLKLGDLDESIGRREWDGPGPTLAPFAPALRCRRAVLTVTIGEELKIEGRGAFADEAEAKDVAALVRYGLVVARDGLPFMAKSSLGGGAGLMKAPLKAAADSLRAAEVKQDGAALSGSLTLSLKLADLAAALGEQALAMRQSNNLKQIGIALHNFHDSHGYLPTDQDNADGKPLLSWRVQILPYLEQEALYKQFNFSEPWDSPHNKALIAKMPEIYAPVKGDTPEPGMTFVQQFRGHKALLPERGRRVNFASIGDGLSNTLGVAESSKAVIWTKPADMEVTEKALPRMGGQFERFFIGLMLDGSVRKIRRDFDEKTMRLAIDPRDRMPIDLDKLNP